MTGSTSIILSPRLPHQEFLSRSFVCAGSDPPPRALRRMGTSYPTHPNAFPIPPVPANRRNMAKAFQTEIIQGKDRGQVPIVNIGSCSFMYKREQNVYLVAVTRQNANAMMCFQAGTDCTGVCRLTANIHVGNTVT